MLLIPAQNPLKYILYQISGITMPDSLAWIASSVLVSNPVLSSIWLICVLTVEKLMFSLAAIS
jgi:hypothetical protein